MSIDTKGKKRKSGDNVGPITKKVKTATAIVSADRPGPLKSALKKAEATTVAETTKDKKNKTKPKSKPTKKEIVVEEEKEEEEEEEKQVDPVVSDIDSDAELTADQTQQLLAGFSSDEDSDEHDDDAAIDAGIPLADLPAPPNQKGNTKALASTTADPESTPGVVYISRLPHGFFEPQLRAYFAQFGAITHLRLARNKRTGKSQHHAFVEFAAASVADIVAKTMDKYLLFGHLLQCRRVPAAQVTEGMWKGPKSVKNGGKVRPRNRIEGSRLRKGVDREGWGKRVEREVQRREGKKEKLKEIGYEFDVPVVKGVDAVGKKEIEAGKGDEVKVVEETVVAAIQPGPDGKAVVQEKKTKRKSKSAGSTTTTTTTVTTKKRKTKA
jgi:nucleolar protein 15